MDLQTRPPVDPSATAADAATPAEPDMLVRQAVRISALRLLFDFASTSRLSEMVPVTAVPASPPWLRGLASLHGIVLPVVDLAMLGQIDRVTPSRSLLLVVGHGESAMAIQVDGLPDRFRLTAAHRAESWTAPDWLMGCVTEGYAHEAEIWLDIDSKRLLDDIEARLRAAVTAQTG